VVAGPNGSGKSTITQRVSFEGCDRLLDPDAIALGLNPSNPSAAAMMAGREVLRRIEDYLGRGVSFAVETTLSSPRSIDLIGRAKSLGYETHLIFVALDSPDRSILRIRNRASRGGHFVPDADVKRRYARSIANLAKAIRLVDIADVYDNSEGEARLVVLVRAGVVVWRATPLPQWIDW